MRFLFHNDTAFNKLKMYALDTWMCLKRGEGEEEIENHGWSGVKSFSQETGATGQQGHGVTIMSRSYTLKSQVQDAHDSPTQLPFFSSSLVFVSCVVTGLFIWGAPCRAEFLGTANEKSSGQESKPLPLPSASPSGAENPPRFKAMPKRFMRAPNQKSPDEKLHDVSEMYEKHFLREMMKAMRSTVHDSGFIQQNQAEKIFREQLDDHYVDKWSEKGGIGLSKIIYEQLIEKFGVQLGIKKSIEKPRGPLPLDEKSNYTAHEFRHPAKSTALSYRIDKLQAPELGQQSRAVKSPWDGVLTGMKKLADDKMMLEITHDNGLKSEVAFKGELSNVFTGTKIQAGETLGFLSSEAKTLYWTVEGDKATGPETVSE